MNVCVPKRCSQASQILKIVKPVRLQVPAGAALAPDSLSISPHTDQFQTPGRNASSKNPRICPDLLEVFMES